MLADLGADVVRLVRPGSAQLRERTHTFRGRRVLEADLKDAATLAGVRDLIQRTDVLIEGFRPGVAERLGLGPDDVRSTNPRLVYGRMTGWGQDGPLAQRAGHDINYISLTGALHAIGTAGQPIPPLNLLGDYGGGSMVLLSGILAALVGRQASGQGAVIDAAMVDGVAYLLQAIWGDVEDGSWVDRRASNGLDGGAPFYRTYACADGKHVAVGAIEPQFFAELLTGLDLVDTELPGQMDRSKWPELADALAGVFITRTRDEWAAVFAATDACVTPVLSFTEAPEHPHIADRDAYVRGVGGVEAAPAPRFGLGAGTSFTTRTSVVSLGEALAHWA